MKTLIVFGNYQLTEKDGKILYEEFSESSNAINFDLIEPKIYTVRLIYDDNKNRIWDAGNYLEKDKVKKLFIIQKRLIFEQIGMLNSSLMLVINSK